MATTSSWFITTKARSSARIRLFCFPYAGGAATIYRQWASSLGPEVEVVPVELPGRGGRIREPAFRDLRRLVGTIADALISLTGREFAFFGHSMGALIAFELARTLRCKGQPQPRCLLVSGREAPQISRTEPLTFDLPDAEFIRELRRLDGTPKEVLEHEELMSLMLPLLRADFELIQTYRYGAGDPLECPITVYGGLQDEEVPRSILLPWREQTVSTFALHMLPGDHFFLRSASKDLLASISAELSKLFRQ